MKETAEWTKPYATMTYRTFRGYWASIRDMQPDLDLYILHVYPLDTQNRSMGFTQCFEGRYKTLEAAKRKAENYRR